MLVGVFRIVITEKPIGRKKTFALIHAANNTYLLKYLNTILLIQVFVVENLKTQKSFFRKLSLYLHPPKPNKYSIAHEIYQIPFLHTADGGYILRRIL
jgi:hypothetical protein